jgi:type VII secretion-associated protein (TIGR03931 family)
MTEVVVEVGPASVRGPNQAEMEWISAGIDGIDDEFVLIDDRAVTVTDVWRRIMRDIVGGFAETIVLVCPTWWSSSRVEQVSDAARTVANDVVVLRRAELLPDPEKSSVELAPEFVVVCSRGVILDVMRLCDIDALLARIPMSLSAVVDVPEGVEGAGLLADHLRANGVDTMIADRDWVQRSIDALRSTKGSGDREDRDSPRSKGRATAALAGTLVSAAMLCGGLAARHNVAPSAADMPMSLLVEGQVGVMVPAQWAVERVTSGPGSARVQAVSPDDATIALHITQSSLAPQQSYEQMAESLRSAVGQEPDGAFVDFNPSDRRVDRTVVTYREVRPDHEIAWFVLIDRSLRVAIGCQSARGREEAVRQVCDRAIGSAHAVF